MSEHAKTINPYQGGRLKKVQFHYPPPHVQLMAMLEEAGLIRVLEGNDQPGFGDGIANHSMGMPFGLSDEMVYVIAFGSLAYAVFLYLKPV